MLYGSKCWALTIADVQILQQNERAMIRWICKVKIRDKISTNSLLNKICFKNLDVTLKQTVYAGLVMFVAATVDKEMHTA